MDGGGASPLWEVPSHCWWFWVPKEAGWESHRKQVSIKHPPWFLHQLLSRGSCPVGVPVVTSFNDEWKCKPNRPNSSPTCFCSWWLITAKKPLRQWWPDPRLLIPVIHIFIKVLDVSKICHKYFGSIHKSQMSLNTQNLFFDSRKNITICHFCVKDGHQNTIASLLLVSPILLSLPLTLREEFNYFVESKLLISRVWGTENHKGLSEADKVEVK